MCFLRRCGIPWNARPPFLGHYNPPPLRAHTSSRVGPTLLSRAWLWYHLLWPRPNCVNIVRFGASYPSQFCSPPKHIAMGEKASTHWREVIPYKHILMCFPRGCGIPWNARPPFLGHYNPPPLRAHASLHVGPTLPSKAWLWYHLLRPRFNCVNIVRFGASYPPRFCSPPKAHINGGKGLYTLKGGHSL